MHGLSKMIFSKLFQPKYKHKDPLVRIQAIETLSAQEAQHKSVLHELAFNDSDNRVSVAALNKLNNFDLWWKMMEIAKDERLAKHARTKVEEALLGNNDITISKPARDAFIKECKNNTLLEALLQKQAISEADTDLYLSVIQRLNKPQLTMRTLLNTQNKALQQALFANIQDEADLVKIVKKAKDTELANEAQQRLDAIQLKKEQPKQLEKEVKLILSKLLALTDESNFEKFSQQRESLTAAFESHQQQFDILEPDLTQSLQYKLTDIQQKLDNKALRLKGEWDAEQELARTSAALESATQRCQQVLSVVEQALTTHAADITLGELESFNDQISEAEQHLNGMLKEKLTDSERRGIEELVNQLLTSRTSLDALPALQQALLQAEDLLTQFQTLSLPADPSQIDAAQMYLDETASRWQGLSSGYRSIWPKTLQNRWQESAAQWRKALKQLRNDLQQQVAKIRGRFNGISRAVEQGRFKQAMRHYEQVKQDYSDLPEELQVKLARQFEKVTEQIENIKDWQAYIAMPKKPELLREIEQLVFNPLPPEEQAERVKSLRKEWNTLGVVDTETDEVLNNAFNLACEEAFKPCREFYAEQEQQRQENLSQKQKLLQELAAFPTDNQVELSKALRQMQSQWKSIGAVDYKDLEPLNVEYKRIVEPIKTKVNQFHKDNAQAKQALLQKATSLLELEDWKEATQQAKQLQEQWKQIEFAGQRQENQLWAEFRAVNDKLFARREQALNEQNDAVVARIKEIEDTLNTAQTKMQESSSRAEIEAFLGNELEQSIQELQSLPRKLNGDATRFAQQLKASLQEKLLYLGDSQRNEQYQLVFDALRHWRQPQAPDEAAELPNYWRQAFHTASLAEHDLSALSRYQLTLLLELNCQQDSPAEDAEARKEMQLRLMTLKLQEGINLEPDELLRSWITKGQLDEDDLTLLPRVEALFLR